MDGQKDLDIDFDSMAYMVTHWIKYLLGQWGVSNQWIDYTQLFVLLVLLIIIAVVIQLLSRMLLSFAFKRIDKMMSFTFFRYANINRLPHFIAFLSTFSFVIGSLPVVFEDFSWFVAPLTKAGNALICLIMVWIAIAAAKAFADVLSQKPNYHNKPLNSYIQIIRMILYAIAAIAIYSIFTGKSATTFFAAMGAASAITALLFKDSIMGFVGNIQISANNIVQIGDRVTIPKFGADGEIEEINLTTVRIRNFDKTTTTVPTYTFVSEAFQNWRGVAEAGIWRFKRSIFVQQRDIRFLTISELDNFANIEVLKSYIADVKCRYDQSASDSVTPTTEQYRITNCDLFLQYGTAYLQAHPRLDHSLTAAVHLLQPTAQGLPIEIYAFVDTVVWMEYEMIIAEVINHLIGSLPLFGLRISESPSNG